MATVGFKGLIFPYMCIVHSYLFHFLTQNNYIYVCAGLMSWSCC